MSLKSHDGLNRSGGRTSYASPRVCERAMTVGEVSRVPQRGADLRDHGLNSSQTSGLLIYMRMYLHTFGNARLRLLGPFSSERTIQLSSLMQKKNVRFVTKLLNTAGLLVV